ncbi:MAG: translation initiation factor IF-3 [Planctomycetota bacterium]|nr:MAG: translation initiation factor IF-3 [Planctomycetota bacterium]
MAHQTHLVNDKIKAEEVLLINEQGQNLGVVKLQEALKIAEEAGLDLVAVNPNAKPIVCKIMDYGKYKYLQKKKPKNKRQGGSQKVKEIRLSPRIDPHDLTVKVRRAREFLESGCKVRFSMRFRGRENMYLESGYQIMQQVLEELQDLAKCEHELKKEGNQLTMILSRQ